MPEATLGHLNPGLKYGLLVGFFLFLYLPISVLIILSFNGSGLPTAWGGMSLRWYAALAQNDKILAAAVNSLVVASMSTIIATILGTLLALGMEQRRRKGGVLEVIAFAPMIIPDIVLAIALLSFFSLADVSLGLHTIVASHVVFNLAYVCAVVRARLKQFDWTLIEASSDLGASAYATLTRVTIPIILPAIVAGALLAFTLSIDEFIIAFFTAGAGRASTTLPMQIYSMIRFGVTPEINALSAIVIALSVTTLAISQHLNKRTQLQ